MRLNGSKYCPSCGQDVALEASLEGAYLLTSCANCGLGLGVKVASAEEVRAIDRAGNPSTAPAPIQATGLPPLARVQMVKKSVQLAPAVEKPARPDPRSASMPPGPGPEASAELPSNPSGSMEAGASIEMSAGSGETGLRQMKSVFIVEDSNFLREVTRDLLVSKGLAREVIDCPDGVAFLEEFARAAGAGRKPELVILDVRMPEMDGREAAFALRAIEAGLNVKRTPILFFSAMLCDEAFKATLAELGNAKYLRKADSGDVQELGGRIVAVLERLVGGGKKSA